MNTLITGVLFVALSCVPTIAQAEVTDAPPTTASMVLRSDLTPAAPLDITPGSTLDYAARETAAPQLAGFAGGSGGVYIGTGALVVVLLVVIIVLVVR